MSDPKDPFNRAVGEQPQERTKQTQRLDDIHDKGNTAHVYKPPRFALGDTRNTAPRGASGTKLGLPTSENQKAMPGLTTGHFGHAGWTHGGIVTMRGYEFSVKVSELPAERNLNHGKIERLVIFKEKTPVANFDRGWNVKPAHAHDIQAVQKVCEVFDPPAREFKPIAPRSPDKDHGHER